ncbi:MAG: hypothetical protein ACWA45_03485 [Flavobacteriales bacterium]
MELAKIEKDLEAYFEGSSNLEQESMLRDYFSNNKVAPHLQVYQPLFVGLKNASKEVSQRNIELPNKSLFYNKNWLSLAASIAVVLGIAGFIFSNKSLSQEEKEALQALNKTKETMLMLSSNLNKGAEELLAINQFTETKNKILK